MYPLCEGCGLLLCVIHEWFYPNYPLHFDSHDQYNPSVSVHSHLCLMCMYRLLPAYEGGIVFTVRDARARTFDV